MEHAGIACVMKDGKLQFGKLQDEGIDHWKDLKGKCIEL